MAQGSDGGAYSRYRAVYASDRNRCSSGSSLAAATNASFVSPAAKRNDVSISPEILFLIKEHAKTLANIETISRRLQALEVKVDQIYKYVQNANSSNCALRVNDCSKKSKADNNAAPTVGNVLVSDDSGGEYSRTTTGTTADEDELLSLLDQIAKCSHQIQQTQQAYQHQNQALSGNLLSRSYQQHSGSSMPALYSSSVPSLTQRMSLTPSPQKQQSLSALLFEPSVERFLSNLDLFMDDQQQQHSQNGVPDGFATPSPSVSVSDTAINRQIERARHLVSRKEQEGIKSQMKLADDWYASHSHERAHPQIATQAKPGNSRIGQRQYIVGKKISPDHSSRKYRF